MAKKKAKRYTSEKKQEILDYIEAQGRGGQTKAVKKYGVTAATIANWKKKASGGMGDGISKGGSKELRAIQELAQILEELEATRAHLAKLEKQYKAAKKKV